MVKDCLRLASGLVLRYPNLKLESQRRSAPNDLARVDDHVSHLPDELVLRIFCLSQPADIARLSQVCQRFKRIADDPSVWPYAYENEPLPLPLQPTIFKSDLRNAIAEAHRLHRYLNDSSHPSQSRHPSILNLVDDPRSQADVVYLIWGRYLVLAFEDPRVIRCYDLSAPSPTSVICEYPLPDDSLLLMSFLGNSSLDHAALNGWVYFPISTLNSFRVYRFAIPSIHPGGPMFQQFFEMTYSAFPVEISRQYIALVTLAQFPGENKLYSVASNSVYKLQLEISEIPHNPILTPHHVIIWHVVGLETVLEAFVLPHLLSDPADVLVRSHRGRLPAFCERCVAIQYNSKTSTSILLATIEQAMDPFASEGHDTSVLKVYAIDFGDNNRINLQPLASFPLRSSYLVSVTPIIDRIATIILTSPRAVNPHYIILRLQLRISDAGRRTWSLEFKKETLVVLSTNDRRLEFLCNASRGDLYWISPNATIYKHKLVPTLITPV